MIMGTAFNQPGQFYKGNLHGHSNNSDGKYAPENVVELYKNQRYDFISITDHYLPESVYETSRQEWTRAITDATYLNTSDFITIIGAEIHTPSLENGDLWHLVAVGLPTDFAMAAEGEDGLTLAKRAHETGAFVGIAHPSWYTLTVAETVPLLPYAHSIEVWNTACTMSNRQDSWPFTDEILTAGHHINIYAADDSHNIEPIGAWCDAFGGWVNVKSESLDADSILTALKAGHYYATNGPEFEDISFDGEKLTIRSTPVDRYFVSAAGARSTRVIGGNLTEAEFIIGKTSWSGLPWGSYLRVTAIDADGKCAWSQPIWLDETD